MYTDFAIRVFFMVLLFACFLFSTLQYFFMQVSKQMGRVRLTYQQTGLHLRSIYIFL